MDISDLEQRKNDILGAIVEAHIATGAPVGSESISRKLRQSLSPATIRNVMVELEQDGLLVQPHTSAGRVPTDRGYRYCVDHLMEPHELTEREKSWVVSQIQSVRTVEALADKVSKIISALTENAAMIYVKNLKRVSFLTHLLEELIEAERIADFFEEDSELFIEGIFRIFDQPEFRDSRKISHLLRAFDRKDDFLEILARDLASVGVQVHIGSENPDDKLENLSLVVKDYYLHDVPVGGIAVIGPTRMKYPKVVSVVSFVADTVSEAVNRY